MKNMNTNLPKNLELASVANFLEASHTNVYIDGKPKLLAEKLVSEVFTSIKQDETYQIKLSDSSCPSIQMPGRPKNDDDMDPRLKNWNKVLKQRRVLQHRIQRHTGKRAEDVLFNRRATIDEPTKKMLLRLMDTAARQDGIPPICKKGLLKRQDDIVMCREIGELFATEPKLLPLEFVGLPEISKLELADTRRIAESQWQRSEVLGKRLEEQATDIKRVLEFCPYLNCLQVVPEHEPYEVPLEKSIREGEDFLYSVSKPTTEEMADEQVEDEDAFTEEPLISDKSEPSSEKFSANNVLKINGCLYGFGDTTGSMTGDMSLFFQCDPLQRMRKTIVHLNNVGGKFIELKWHQISTVNKGLWQQVPRSSEFVFDSQPFVLLPGEQRRIDVLFQPLEVGIKKERWVLRMQRSPFCGTRRLHVFLFGMCTEPASYRERLDKQMHFVVNKRKVQVTERLAGMHAELAPIVESVHLDCPYERALDERELFSAQNPGFRSERYADLETLKELHQLVKKPRQPAWDYRIETIRQCIYQHQADQREALQLILIDLIEPMRCNSDEIFSKVRMNPERERTCFVYVRGIVCSSLEEWEVLAEGLEMQFFKAELQRFVNNLKELGQRMSTHQDYLDFLITKKVRSSKYFRDALYIQTYTVLCDAAENIVSAIESTVHL